MKKIKIRQLDKDKYTRVYLDSVRFKNERRRF